MFVVAVTATVLASTATAHASAVAALNSLVRTPYSQATSMVAKKLGISMLVVLPLSSVSSHVSRLGPAKVKATGVLASARRYIYIYIYIYIHTCALDVYSAY